MIKVILVGLLLLLSFTLAVTFDAFCLGAIVGGLAWMFDGAVKADAILAAKIGAAASVAGRFLYLIFK